MLDPKDRGEFFDIIVALLSAISGGEVKTGYAWAELPNNRLIHGVQLLSTV